MTLYKTIAALVLFFTMTACGNDENSETSSLIGGVAGIGGTRDCETFTLIGVNDFRCFAYSVFFENSIYKNFNGSRFDTLFQLDDRFTQNQKVKLFGALAHLDNQILKYMNQKRSGQPSDFVTCTVASGNREILPQNYVGNDRNASAMAAQMMDGLLFLMKFHREKGIPLKVTFMSEPSVNGIFTVGSVAPTGGIGKYYGAVGTSQQGDFAINTAALDSNFTPQEIAGTMFHEMMHRVGYTHNTFQKSASDPVGTKGTLIKEAGKCIQSGTATPPLGLAGNRMDIQND